MSTGTVKSITNKLLEIETEMNSIKDRCTILGDIMTEDQKLKSADKVRFLYNELLDAKKELASLKNE